MPSEFYPGLFDSRETTPSQDKDNVPDVSAEKDERRVLPKAAGPTEASETFTSRACGNVFGTPTSQCYTLAFTPSSVNSFGLGLERQAAREQIGMSPVLRSHPVYRKERGIIGLLAMGQERVLHFVSGGLGKQKYTPHDSPDSIIESLGSSGKDVRDAQSLASQEQHVVFSDPTLHKDPEKESETPEDTPATLAGGSSGSSSSGGFSIHSRKTPYPSPVVLGELILQQAKEEADGSNDDDGDRKKKVRLASRSHSTRSPSSSSVSSNTVGSKTGKNTRPVSRTNSHKHGNKLGRAIKRILFLKPKRQYSHRSDQRRSISTSETTVSVDTGVITPTLPQGGTQELSINKQIPPLMIKGLDRDFLPTEATLVPTPLNSPIVGGGPLSFEEAMSTLPATTDPTPTSSELKQLGVIFEQTASPEVILTRPLLTQDMNEISPFYKMSESFPAPPTPPLPKASSNTKGPEEGFRLPKLDTHGLLREDSHSDKFGHQQKKPSRRKSTTTATVLAFLSKPFTKRDRRDLVASVSKEKDKDSARVGLKDRYLRDAKRRNNFDSAYSEFSDRSGSRSMTASPALGFKKRATLPIVEEKKPFYEFSRDLGDHAIIGAMEHVQEEDPIVENGDDKGVRVEDNTKKKPVKLDAAAIVAGALGSGTSTVPVSPSRGAFFPPLEMSPSPPSPILRPASTIPTTVRHERVSGNNLRPTPRNLIREEEEEMTVTPLPLVPLKGDRDDAAYRQSVNPGTTPAPSPATQWSGVTMGTGESESSEEILNKRRGRVGPYAYKSETGTLEADAVEDEDDEDDGVEVGGRKAPRPTRDVSEEVVPRSRSRGESGASMKSWMTGRTTLDAGDSTGKATMGSGTGSGMGASADGDSYSAVVVGMQSEDRGGGGGGDEEEEGGRRCRSMGGECEVEDMIGVEIERWELMVGKARASRNEEYVD